MGVLSTGVREGFKYRVGKSTIRVKKVLDAKTIIITVDGTKDYTITDAERTEVFPEVFIYCGVPDNVMVHDFHSRLAFEAPLHIKIERIRATPRVPRRGAGEGARHGVDPSRP